MESKKIETMKRAAQLEALKIHEYRRGICLNHACLESILRDMYMDNVAPILANICLERIKNERDLE